MPDPQDAIQDAIRSRSIGEFILPDVPQVLLTDSLSTAVDKYKESPYSVVLVVDGNGNLVGMMTDTDLVGKAGAGTVQSAIPQDDVIAVRDNATLSELLELLNGGNKQKRILDRVPVVDSSNKPLGIVDRDKLTIRVGDLLAAS